MHLTLTKQRVPAPTSLAIRSPLLRSGPSLAGIFCLTVAPKMHSSLASRINSASEGIRRPLEPLVAHLCSVAPHQFGSTSGAHDVFLCFQGLSGVDAVYRRDSWLLLRA